MKLWDFIRGGESSNSRSCRGHGFADDKMARRMKIKLYVKYVSAHLHFSPTTNGTNLLMDKR